MPGGAVGSVGSSIDSLPIAKSNYLSFLPTEITSPALDVSFRVSPTSRIEVQGFPFLFGISQILGEDPWFLHPVFESDASGVIHREGGIVTLRDLNLETKGRLALRGEISIAANQSVSGKLQVGLAEVMIADAPTSRLNSMFGPGCGAMRPKTVL